MSRPDILAASFDLARALSLCLTWMTCGWPATFPRITVGSRRRRSASTTPSGISSGPRIRLSAGMDAEDGFPVTAERLPVLIDTLGDTGDLEVMVLALDELAAVRAASGKLALATVLLQRSDALMVSAGTTHHDTDRLDARRARSLLKPGGSTP